jgi:peroxidase
MTAVSSYLDLSIVYGSSEDTLRGLREFRGGRLLVARRGGREWLPPSNNRSADCETADDEEACYRSGRFSCPFIIM